MEHFGREVGLGFQVLTINGFQRAGYFHFALCRSNIQNMMGTILQALECLLRRDPFSGKVPISGIKSTPKSRT